VIEIRQKLMDSIKRHIIGNNIMAKLIFNVNVVAKLISGQKAIISNISFS
jgi:hypothetical protein